MRSRDTLDKPADDDLLMTTCFDTLRYLSYSLYNFEIKLPKREQQMLNACFEPVVIVFCSFFFFGLKLALHGRSIISLCEHCRLTQW